MVGAEVAFAFRLSSKVIGLIMTFGVGALISFELVEPALESTRVAQVSLALLIGALTFFVGDMLIEHTGANRRKHPGLSLSGSWIIPGCSGALRPATLSIRGNSFNLPITPLADI